MIINFGFKMFELKDFTFQNYMRIITFLVLKLQCVNPPFASLNMNFLLACK